MSIADLNKIFSDNLRRIRGSRSQCEMADIIGVTQPEYHRWESGDVLPRSNNLKKISRQLKVSETLLLSPGGLSEDRASEELVLILPCSNRFRSELTRWAVQAGESIEHFILEVLKEHGEPRSLVMKIEREKREREAANSTSTRPASVGEAASTLLEKAGKASSPSPPTDEPSDEAFPPERDARKEENDQR